MGSDWFTLKQSGYSYWRVGTWAKCLQSEGNSAALLHTWCLLIDLTKEAETFSFAAGDSHPSTIRVISLRMKKTWRERGERMPEKLSQTLHYFWTFHKNHHVSYIFQPSFNYMYHYVFLEVLFENGLAYNFLNIEDKFQISLFILRQSFQLL